MYPSSFSGKRGTSTAFVKWMLLESLLRKFWPSSIDQLKDDLKKMAQVIDIMNTEKAA